MPHDHHHDHGHSHLDPAAMHGRAFAIGIALNACFVFAEILYGIQANSLSLLADAGHNAGDVLGLFMAGGALILSRREPSERYTYGLQSSSIMAALANAVLLLVAVGGVGWEALTRLFHPETSAGLTVMVVAAAGVCVNGFTAWLFMKGREHDLNVRTAFRHMLADALIAFGVVVTGGIMLKTGWKWLDPVVSLIISVTIIMGTLDLLKDSLNLALHAVPENVDLAAVRAYFAGLEGVTEVHDLDIWAMSTTETALSVHLLMPGGHPGGSFIVQINERLAHDHHIGHATIQIEVASTSESCPLASPHVT